MVKYLHISATAGCVYTSLISSGFSKVLVLWQIQVVCFLELSGVFVLNIFDLWFVESENVKPINTEGQL